MSYQTLSYSELYTLLNELTVDEHPSELHGLMTGWLVSEDHRRIALDAIAPQAATHEGLQSLLKETQHFLEDEQLRFMPLLPEEGRSSRERSEGLAYWCLGFTTSLGLSGFDSAQYPELMEVIEDLVAISHIDFDDVDDDEETELEELIEYVRMGVMLIDTEIRSVNDSGHSQSNNQQDEDVSDPFSDDEPPTYH